VAELAQAGVRRISVGGALARAAWSGFLQAAKEIAEQGTFTNLAGVSSTDLNGSFRLDQTDSSRRGVSHRSDNGGHG
ncbi:MAG: hypothetical protein ACREJ4_01070, partial [Candidatus Methylomirabilaceae bacterium]